MAKFTEGEFVYVPAACLPDPDSQAYALVRRKVLKQAKRSVTVDIGEGESVSVGSMRVHDRRLGFLVLKVGDFATEDTLLDPLAKSVVQFLRLLLSDSHVRGLSVRTLDELDAFWGSNHNAYSHVVLIGHSAADSL